MSRAAISIRPADGREDVAEIKRLFLEYAQALYRDLGFVEIPPYYPSPAVPLRYFELTLE